MAKNWKNAKEYFITYSILINAAQHAGVATYQEIAQACGLPTAGAFMGSIIGQILGQISQNELAHNRPFLSGIAVGVNGKPGDGFYNWAKDSGVMKEGQDNISFLIELSHQIYEEWKIPYRISHKQ